MWVYAHPCLFQSIKVIWPNDKMPLWEIMKAMSLMLFPLEVVSVAVKSAGRGNRVYKPVSMSSKEYQAFAKAREPSRSVWTNCLRAFLSGGIICAIGQGVTEFFVAAFKMSSKDASNPTVAVMILLSVILTSLGVYDKIAHGRAPAARFRLRGSPTPCVPRRSSIAAKDWCLESERICSSWRVPLSYSESWHPSSSA